jgi:septal ring factor EnvC (AmiA/AmiB activator)
MRGRRFLFAALLYTGCCLLPGAWASPVSQVNGQDEKKTTKADADETEKAIASLQNALKATEKELAATNKSLDELKAAAADAKVLRKEVAAATKEAADRKAELDKLTLKANSLATELPR